ncbi:hypothetical protein EE88_21685 [Salmonella enterica]|nr:hypothetical protein [Salmonella enterica]
MENNTIFALQAMNSNMCELFDLINDLNEQVKHLKLVAEIEAPETFESVTACLSGTVQSDGTIKGDVFDYSKPKNIPYLEHMQDIEILKDQFKIDKEHEYLKGYHAACKDMAGNE